LVKRQSGDGRSLKKNSGNVREIAEEETGLAKPIGKLI